tara:strand:+ start:1243 stop:1752 length:510 start_codon:yes stop_codon:yes gene_type:complete
MTRSIREVHRDYCLEEARSYYLDRGEWMTDIWMLSGRDGKCAWRGWGHNQKKFNMRAIVDISCIPFFFWKNLGVMNFEYENAVEEIEPEDRNDYFEWAYENHYHGWDRGVLEWVKGFHPGRWILMDMKRGEVMEDIRDLEDYGAYIEERFIRSKDHIDDLIAGKSPYNI